MNDPNPNNNDSTSALAISEIDPNEIIEEPNQGINVVDMEGAVVVPPQDVNDDVITITIRDDELPDAVLKAVLLGLSEEQQALKNIRITKEKENKFDARLSISRGTILKYMSDTLIQRQALVGGSGELDLKGPKFREIIKMFLGTISETFDEVKIPPEFKDLFFHALSRNLDGWEHRAEKILKNIH